MIRTAGDVLVGIALALFLTASLLARQARQGSAPRLRFSDVVLLPRPGTVVSAAIVCLVVGIVLLVVG